MHVRMTYPVEQLAVLRHFDEVLHHSERLVRLARVSQPSLKAPLHIVAEILRRHLQQRRILQEELTAELLLQAILQQDLEVTRFVLVRAVEHRAQQCRCRGVPTVPFAEGSCPQGA
eukprot:1177352-Prorocentrum_minimum.AAC.1